MELDELKRTWQDHTIKLEKSLQLNQRNIELIQTQKIASNLSPLYWHRAIELTLHVIAIGLLLVFIARHLFELPYVVSGILLLAMYGVLTFHATKQIQLLSRIDYSQELVALQSTLLLLQTHIISYSRMVVLFIPAFLAYPVVATKVIQDFHLSLWDNFDILRHSNGQWWNVQLIATALLVPLGIWFYGKISLKNIDTKWVHDFITRMTGRRINQALEFLKEWQELKN